MAMAQVFIPSHQDPLPPLLPPPSSPSSFLPPPSSPSSFLPPPTSSFLPSTSSPHARWEEDTISDPPPAPPPSPEMLPLHLNRVFEIDPKMFENSSRRWNELPPSPTYSFEFSSVFTPNKSPLLSEPDSPTYMSPGEFPDSTHSPPNFDLSPPVDSGLQIPTPCPSVTGQGHAPSHIPVLSHSHSEGDSFHALQLPHLTLCNCTSLLGGRDDNTLHPTPRPRSHTHPSHSLTLHATYTSEQLRERRQEVHRLHPHLPLTFETASLPHATNDKHIADSGFHEATEEPISSRKKISLKRKSEELGYEAPTLLYSCATYNSPNNTDSSWLVIENASTSYPQGKKACQEGVLRRQSASFSGGFTLPGSSLADSSTFSAPSTPNPSLGVTDPSNPHFLSSFPSQGRRHTFDFNSSVAGVLSSLPALQSMETGEMEGESQEFGGQMESIDAMDCDLSGQSEVDTLSHTLCRSHLGQLVTQQDHPIQFPHFPAVFPPMPSLPPVMAARSHSSGEGCADFSFGQQIPGWLVQGSDGSFPGHRGPAHLDSMTAAECKFVLSKSL